MTGPELATGTGTPGDVGGARLHLLEWVFGGHGSAGPRCNRLHLAVLEPGHSEEGGEAHYWEEKQTCHRSECPECFRESDGYCSREAAKIDRRVSLYFALRNLAIMREGPLRRSRRLLSLLGLRVWLGDRAGRVERDRDAEEIRANALRSGWSEEKLDRALEGNRRMWTVALGKWTDSERRYARRLLTLAERDRGRARLRRPIHVVVSPPPSRYAEVLDLGGYRRLRDEAYRQAEARGIDGGVAVFHHQRLRSSRWEGNLGRFGPDELDCPVAGPHWHIIGEGWVTESRACEEVRCGTDGRYRLVADPVFGGYVTCPDWHPEVDWVVTNLGIRESVRGTAFYALTHASFAKFPEPGTAGMFPSPEMVSLTGDESGARQRASRPPVETVTWFGDLSPARFRCPPPAPKRPKCRICSAEYAARDLVRLDYPPTGPPLPLSEDGTGRCDAAEWRAVRPSTGESVRGSRSERLRRLLDLGAWKVQAPRVPLLDRLAAEQEADRRDREESDREDARATFEGRGLRPLRRRETRVAFETAVREETERP